jgi:hypothetical protein
MYNEVDSLLSHIFHQIDILNLDMFVDDVDDFYLLKTRKKKISLFIFLMFHLQFTQPLSVNINDESRHFSH